MFSIRTSFSGLRKIELVDCPSAKEWIKHDPSCDSRKWEIVCCIIVTLVMIWQWAAHGHNPAPGHTSVHSPQLRWCNIMTLLWQYVTWSGNCQDHQGDGDIGDVVAVGAVERMRGICDSDPSPSVWHLSQMRCSCYAVMTRDMRPDTIVQHCHPSCHQRVASW